MSFHGLTLTEVTDIDGVQESGGKRKTGSYSGKDRDYADLWEEGRDEASYSVELHSATRADLEEAIAEFNTAPFDAEFYPRESDRCVYAAYASANRPKILQTAGPSLYYYADAEIIARNGYTYGTEQGTGLLKDVALPYTGASLTNAGYYDSTLDFLYLSGGYDGGPTKDITLNLGDYSILLCSQMMWKDSFKVDRFGNVLHSKETDFPMIYTSLQAALGGATYADYGTGGRIGHEAFYMGNSAKLYFPFHGPLPVQEPPYLELTLSGVVGSPAVEYALAGDLTDSEVVSFTLKDGVNKIYIPDCDGEDFVAFGLTTDSTSSCTVENALAEVRRYISPDEFPVLPINESFGYSITDEEHSNHILEALHFVYRDVF